METSSRYGVLKTFIKKGRTFITKTNTKEQNVVFLYKKKKIVTR